MRNLTSPNSSPYNSRQRAQHAQVKQSNMPVEQIDILVSGFAAGSESNVVPYLQQKSKKQWSPLNVQFDQGQMLLSVDGPVLAHAITRLNGYIFGTQPVSFALAEWTWIADCSVASNSIIQLQHCSFALRQEASRDTKKYDHNRHVA